MRRSLFRAVLAAVVASVVVSTTVDATVLAPEVEWQRRIENEGVALANDVVETDDGSFLIAGYAHAPKEAVGQLLLLRVDRDGNELWQRRLTAAVSASSVARTPDGGFALVGDSHETGRSALYLARTDASGTLLWERRFGRGLPVLGSMVRVDRNGDIVAAGYEGWFGWATGLVVKTDPDGNELWSRELTQPLKGSELGVQPTSLVVTSDGGYLVGGLSVFDGVGTPDWFYLGKLSSEGDLLWERIFEWRGRGIDSEDPETFRESRASRQGIIAETADGRYAFVGGVGVRGEGFVPVLLHFDSGGRFLGQTRLPGPEHMRQLEVMEDGGYVITGSIAVSVGPTHLVRTDASGRALWDLVVGPQPSASGTARRTNDGGFVAVGTTSRTDLNPGDIYVVKLSAEHTVEKLFLRGDTNRDATLDISDAVATLGWLFLGGQAPCADAADANDDGRVDISDASYTLSYLFLGGATVPLPYPDPGRDETADEIDCSR
jgi:hypothetical protein